LTADRQGGTKNLGELKPVVAPCSSIALLFVDISYSFPGKTRAALKNDCQFNEVSTSAYYLLLTAQPHKTYLR
jgi:hypothetical protein